MGTTSEKLAHLLTNAEVAAILGINPKTLHEMRYRGEGPAYVKIGHRTLRFRPEDVDAWIEAQSKRPA